LILALSFRFDFGAVAPSQRSKWAIKKSQETKIAKQDGFYFAIFAHLREKLRKLTIHRNRGGKLWFNQCQRIDRYTTS